VEEEKRKKQMCADQIKKGKIRGLEEEKSELNSKQIQTRNIGMTGNGNI